MFENFDDLFTTRNYKITFLSVEFILSDCSDLLQVSLFPAPATGHPWGWTAWNILGIWGSSNFKEELQSLQLSDNSLTPKTEKCEFHSNMKHRS